MREGYPDDQTLLDAEFRLRLGLHVVDGIVCFRDLYDLTDWDPACPDAQQAELANGYYEVTLCSSTPPSGVLGDGQVILVYLQRVAAMLDLARQGVPTLVGS